MLTFYINVIGENIRHIYIYIYIYIYTYNIQPNLSGAKSLDNSLMSCERPRVTFGQRTWSLTYFVFIMLSLKNSAAKVNFLHYEFVQKRYARYNFKTLYIILVIALERFPIVTHS